MGLLGDALNGAIDIVLLLVILVVLVVIHEFGHFIVARRAKVRVHEFGIGFPPRARVLGRDSETEYTLNWLPIGGFVRLEGEEGESADPRAFVNAKLRTRLAILAAGVTMNILLAFVIFSAIAGIADPVTDLRIGYTVPGSPAQTAGLVGGQQIGTDSQGNPIYDETGDLITAIDGRHFPVFDSDIAPGGAQIAYLDAHAGQQVILTVRHGDGTVTDMPVTLRIPTATDRPLGVGFNAAPTENITRGPVDAVTTGFRRTIDASTLILRGLRDLVSDLAHPQVSGPVGVVEVVGAIRSSYPPTYLFWLFGALSANLAVVNFLPFPPLDGGRFAISIVQAITRNRISPRVERGVYLTGFLLLMGFLLWITLFDLGVLHRASG